MSPNPERQYETGHATDNWEVGIFRERGLLPDGTEPTWEEYANAHNEYYGCSARSPYRLHVDEDGRAYRLPGNAR